MKKNILFLLLCISTIVGYANVNHTTSKGSYRVVITKVTGQHSSHFTQPIDCPEVFYESNTNYIAIDFGVQPINDYTVTISSPFTDMDYFVTSSYTTIPLSVDGISDYSIIIETADGDVFEGVLLASDYSSVDSM